jgi:hypothetical protein
MEADGLNHLESGTNRGDAGDPFPGTSNNTVFNDTTNPSSKLYCSTGIGFCDPSGVSITGISASGATMTATMAVGAPVETVLLNGVPQSGSITGTSSQSTWVYYYIDLLSGTTNLVIDLYNLSGDVDLYVRKGSKPTPSTYDCRSWNQGTTNEQCIFSAPSSGRWWICVNNYDTGTISYTIKATWSGGESPRQGVEIVDFDGD